MHKSSFSIVCCFYNEINILKTKFVNFLNDVSNIEYEYEIIICDNKSDDGTTEYLKDLEKKNPKLKFIFNSKNLGKGGSIKEAIKYSKKEYIVIFDIDEYLLDDLIQGFKKIQEQNNIDFLIGNRIHKKNQLQTYTLPNLPVKIVCPLTELLLFLVKNLMKIYLYSCS